MKSAIAIWLAIWLPTLAACPAPTAAPPTSPPVVAAPADAPPPPPPLDQDLPRLALRGVELYEEVARVFAAAGTDCPAATTQLRALEPTYAPVATANAKVLHDGGAKALRAALEPHATRLDAAAKAIATSATLAQCSANRDFTEAFDELVGAP